MITNCIGVQEVMPYIDQATLRGAIVTATSVAVSALVVHVSGGSVTLAPIVVSFTNVTHVNFVFTKEMDFVALTPQGPLSLRRTNGISGRYLQAEFFS